MPKKIYRTATHKECTYCGRIRLLTEFHKNKQNKDGLHYECVYCRRDRVREYLNNKYRNNEEFRKEKLRKQKERYRTDPEFRAKRAEYSRKYRERQKLKKQDEELRRASTWAQGTF